MNGSEQASTLGSGREGRARVRPEFTALVRDLPATVPFAAPEGIERRMGRPLRLRLGANESAFGASPRALEAARAALRRSAWYGDPDGHDLREAVAARLGSRIENVALGSGIDDLLSLVVRTFLEPGQVAVGSLGSYPMFPYLVAGIGGRVERVPYRDDRNDLEALSAATHRTGARILFLANPDNPSGTFHSAERLQAFVDGLPQSCLLLLDEAYVEFAPSGTAPSLDPDDPRVLRVRTFSKAHGMAGLRIGYAVAAAETVEAFDRIRLHFAVNRVAQAAALASLQDDEFIASVVAQVDAGRRDYVALARDLGLSTIPSATNFVAFDVGGADRARAVVGELLEDGVFVRMPSAPPLDRCIRVTVGSSQERAEFALSLRRAIDRNAEERAG